MCRAHDPATISPEPLGRFLLSFTQMFLSVRRCAEPMNWLHKLKVKVKLQSHVIYPSICVHSISPLHSNIHLSEVVCRTNDSASQSQGLGHTSRSKYLHFNFVSFESPQPLVRFSLNITQMFLLVGWCAEPMTRYANSVKLQGQGILGGYGCPSGCSLVSYDCKLTSCRSFT